MSLSTGLTYAEDVANITKLGVAHTVNPEILAAMSPRAALQQCVDAYNANEDLRLHYGLEADKAERIYKGTASQWVLDGVRGTDRKYWKERFMNFQQISDSCNAANHELAKLIYEIKKNGAAQVVASNYRKFRIID